VRDFVWSVPRRLGSMRQFHRPSLVRGGRMHLVGAMQRNCVLLL
jgi:hypothetical protein